MTFDIYTGDNFFQGDGNSFWTDVIVNCIGAFVGFTLSLLIYRHQIKRDNRKEAEAKQDTDKAQLRYFAAVADTFIKNAKKQLELLDSYIEEQKKEPSDLKSLKKVPSYDFTRLLNNDNKDVLEAWIKNINSENSVID